jgi:hypothetical protein
MIFIRHYTQSKAFVSTQILYVAVASRRLDKPRPWTMHWGEEEATQTPEVLLWGFELVFCSALQIIQCSHFILSFYPLWGRTGRLILVWLTRKLRLQEVMRPPQGQVAIKEKAESFGLKSNHHYVILHCLSISVTEMDLMSPSFWFDYIHPINIY